MESELDSVVEQSINDRYSLWAHEALSELPESFTVTDPCISGQPIVFASKGFLKMMGYSKSEVLGKNGRIFQGPATCRRSVIEIREAIREERGVEISLVNYRRDGRPFWMLFQMSPVFSKEDGRVIHFVGVQVPILRKPSSRRRRRNVVGWVCEESVYGSCRREVCLDSAAELSRALSLECALDDGADDDREVEIEETCEASELEKQRAASAMKNILSVLTHYSEVTGRQVCGKRCSLTGVGLLSSTLNTSLGRIKQSFVLTDPHLPDMPIVYASEGFFKLTGYPRDEVLGRNCRFLSGEDTDCCTIYRIKESIQNEKACTVRILNYRKDKSSFWNLLHISPIRNASGKIAYFVGVQMEEACKSQDVHGLSPEMRQLSAVGAVRIAVRSLSMGAGTSKS